MSMSTTARHLPAGFPSWRAALRDLVSAMPIVILARALRGR